MTRRRDDLFTSTDARFKPRERGRFGDNEYSQPARGRVTGSADIVDLDLIYARTSDSGKAIGIVPWKGYVGPPVYLPLSQIEYEPKDATNGQKIRVTLPRWLAREKGLIE